MKSYLHGENFLEPVDKMPKGSKKFKQYIIGHSETGHHHTLKSKTEFEVTEFEKDLYVQIFEPTDLVHEKTFDVHETLTVEPGIYKVHHKTEYNPFTKVIEKVWD